MESQDIAVGGWTILATEDDDGHLKLVISHEDGSVVRAFETTDSEANSEPEWDSYFTTDQIERKYQEEM